jgi:hypothetical protein
MHPISIKVFWWPYPKLAQEHERDVARLVRWFGLASCVVWLRSPQNELRNPRLLLLQPPAWEQRDNHPHGLAALSWRAVFTAEKLMVLGFAAFAIGGTTYVGDPALLVYLGGAFLFWWLLYFGSLFLALRRWYHWLKLVACKNASLEPEPTEAECRAIVMHHRLAIADVDDDLLMSEIQTTGLHPNE